jgi:hypothetical protein
VGAPHCGHMRLLFGAIETRASVSYGIPFIKRM